MFGIAELSALFVSVLLAVVAATSDQGDMGLCSQVFLMHQYCTRDSSAVVSNPSHHQRFRVGKAGPRGPPGPPGRSSAVDYSMINDRIDERLEGLEEALSKIRQLEDLLTWYKASNGYFYKIFKEWLNYADAKAKCAEVGGILASAGPRDPDVRRDLVTFMRSSGLNSLWIGANDIAREGTWVWEDGVTSNAMDWSTSPRQPDNAGNNEDCAHYYAGYGWKVNDAPCDTKAILLCEKTYRAP